ncbi:FAD-dependent oxidoreductase [Natronomonas halophila]|uniref:FAD-dependent oxidoreductase n=1 Tax=Natronomonas halophila TaxID=2747817 RepID=UPI0015B3B9F5|nr:FAD-dependent oxidoreductase [Natronomonas halophila]QLD86557.1 FAD-dependent oxidoreductase [Natronomonas halophila]
MDPIETTVAAVRDVGPDAVAIDLETPEDFSAEPGQFVKLSTEIDGETEAGFYTVSSPDTDETFEFTISYDPEEGGAFSEYLLSIEAGDAVTITGPFGSDYYEGEARVVVLAGGPGVGPAVAIAERALADGNEAAIVYRDDNPLHEDRLATIAGTGADVFILNESEPLTAAVDEVLTNDAGEQVFIYGFADFLEDANNAISAAGGDPDEAKAENFG